MSMITTDKLIRGGEPCLKGTRIPVAQLLMEIAQFNNLSAIKKISEDYNLSSKDVLCLYIEIVNSFKKKPIEQEAEYPIL